jgi:hypothetical protein
LADVSNQNRRKNHRVLVDSDASEPSDDSDPDEDEKVNKFKRVESLARMHTIMKMLWLRDDRKIFKTPLDDSYNPLERFQNADCAKQGQIREVLETIPTEYHEAALNKEWVTHAVRI